MTGFSPLADARTQPGAPLTVLVLRDCPRCLADAAVAGELCVICMACGLIGPKGGGAADAVARWNGPTADVIDLQAHRRNAPNGQDEGAAQATEATNRKARSREVGSQGEVGTDRLNAHPQTPGAPAEVATTASAVGTQSQSDGVKPK